MKPVGMVTSFLLQVYPLLRFLRYSFDDSSIMFIQLMFLLCYTSYLGHPIQTRRLNLLLADSILWHRFSDSLEAQIPEGFMFHSFRIHFLLCIYRWSVEWKGIHGTVSIRQSFRLIYTFCCIFAVPIPTFTNYVFHRRFSISKTSMFLFPSDLVITVFTFLFLVVLLRRARNYNSVFFVSSALV